MKRLSTVFGLAVLLGASGVAIAANALFDEGHDQQWPMSSHDGFDDARSALLLAGHTITALHTPITLAALSGHDIFVTGTLNSSYTADEVDALHAYVASGGSVFVNHDGGWSSSSATPSMNSFLATYGMELAGHASHTDGVVVTGFVAHTITQGVGTLGLDFVRQLVRIDPPAEDLTLGSVKILAIYESPSGGQVIVLPDDTLWTDPDIGTDYGIEDHDNLTMLLNIFDYIDSVATQGVSWTAVKGLFR